jgi:hypothetical protein
MCLTKDQKQFPARARIGIRRKDAKRQLRIFSIEVDVGQREQEGEEQERRGVEKLSRAD